MSNEIPAGTTPASPPNSTMAVVSLISGILGLTLLPIIGGLVALFTGYYARKEIRESYGALGGEGLATIGIVLGWISIALMAIVDVTNRTAWWLVGLGVLSMEVVDALR